MKHKTIKLETLGALQDRGFRLWITCRDPDCTQEPTEALADLIDAFGPHREFLDLEFKCTTCGGKAGLTLHDPD